MANGGTELAENKANNCPPLAGDQGGGKRTWIPCEKTKADDANNCAMNKHSRFAGCLQKKVCGIILMIVECLTPWVGTVRGTCRVHNTDESFMVFVDFLTYYVWTLPTCPLLAVMQGSISKIR
ncbi:MAG: hypothetical protein CV082_01410 [Candidatus Brocadia sp. BL1]|nr:MAG: hypothetical protein CV082_01410 [Candidatus Brocadia sp. BL1]